MNAQKAHAVWDIASVRTPARETMEHNKNDPARCVNTMCAGPRRTGLEFD